MLTTIFESYDHLVTVENGCKIGGFGSSLLEYANSIKAKNTIKIFGVADFFVNHGSIKQLHEIAEIDTESIKNYINFVINTN